MGYSNNRLLRYETNASDNNYLDYGEIVQIITDKLVNVSLGGSGYLLEAIGVEGNFIPRIGDWVTIEWSNGNPVARGSSDINGGLREPNPPVIVSPDDLADGTIDSDHIRTNTIEARHISAYAIQAEHISANTIQTEHISSNTIVAGQIQAGAINATNIQANAINATHITANAINATHIQASAIQVQHLSANSVQTNQISANSIDATKIKADAINATHISANSITSSEISANAITATHITANAIQTQHISSNSITGDKIQANQISANHITANAINATHITANAINAQHITANSISANHITANAIRTQHISANSVQAGHISANSIQTGHISANTINSGHIQAGVINATHITANAITTQHISSNTIQGQHISANSITGNHIVAGTIQSGHISSNSINAGHITSNTINANHITANAITAVKISSDAIETRHLSANSIYGDKISANQISANHITANAINATHITANAVQAQHISANSITGDKISGGTITGDKISGGTITGDKISGGAIDTDHLSVGTRKEGLLGQYYTYSAGANTKFQTYKGHQIDPTVNFSWGTGSPTVVGQADSFAVRWQGFVYAPETGSYSFHLTADDTGKIVVNNTVVVNIPTYTGVETTGTISLTQGQWYPIMIEVVEGTGGATAIVKWTKPSLVKEVIPSKYFTQGNTVIDGATITTGSITATNIQVGTITAQSGIIADATIQTAHIASGSITNAKIANAEITTAKIASGNITNALIADATITHAKIQSVNADTITVGHLNGEFISGGTITGDKISGNTITGDKITANSIDSAHIKAGAITTSEISAGAVTSDRIQAGAVTSDIIRAGSISAQHISTVGLDAQLVQVYNGLTGETLIGAGYLRVDGLDVGVVQSDNLLVNGMFLTSSDQYGIIRSNQQGQSILGLQSPMSGGSQVWSYDNTNPAIPFLNFIDIIGKKPVDIVFNPTGTIGYVSAQGTNSVYKVDLTNRVILGSVSVGVAPSKLAMYGSKIFVLNGDINDTSEPDTISVIDTNTFIVTNSIFIGESPFDFVMNGNMLYVSCSIAGVVYVVDMDKEQVVDAINVIENTSYPTGIAISSDKSLLYVVDGLLNVLWVISLATKQIINQIPIGNGSSFISVSSKTNKIFISCTGSDSIYVLDEANVLPPGNGNVRKVYTGYKPVGLAIDPSKSIGGYLYIALSQAGVVGIFDITLEMLVGQVQAGANVLTTKLSPDFTKLYAVNNGDLGIISFVYPSGNFIGDAYVGADSTPKYQGAYGWVPNRSDWILSPSGSIIGASTVEFHIGEPFQNEGGYAKLQTVGGAPYQYSQMEQDVYLVKNYSNGNNTLATTGNRLTPYAYVGSGSARFYPNEVEWLNSPAPKNFIVSHGDGSGNILTYTANASNYTLTYGSSSSVTFSGGIVPSGGWVTADYTVRDNVWFDNFNGSVEINIDPLTTPNSATTFEIDEYVPKYVVVEDQQTSSFTPSSDGISSSYSGLILSTITNQASNVVSGNIVMSGGSGTYHYGGTSDSTDISRVVNGDTTSTTFFDAGTGNAYVKLDLGAVYMIGEIDVWHYYTDARKCHGAKTEISEDGITWTTVFNSAVSGEYTETASGNKIVFDAKPTRFVRDWLNGNTINNSNRWVEIKAYGDWVKDTSYKYPNTVPMTLNGSIIRTSVQGAYAQYNINCEYTTQWYYTYLTSPSFGVSQVFVDGTEINYPVADGTNRLYLFQNSNITAPTFYKSSVPLKPGTHTIIIKQSTGTINIDRFRFEDFQYYNRGTLLINNASGSDFTRYKIVPTQAKNYVGTGRQSTDGPYDTVRINPKTGSPDGSVAIKYRFRVRNELANASGSVGQGIAYVTSAVFEKGKLSTSWRMSQSLDKMPSIRTEDWSKTKPTTTGVQTKHIANGAIQGEKIHSFSIDNHHISPFAKISEFKLALNYPTHDHTNKSFLDSQTGWAGTNGNFGTGNTVARGDHKHDNLYLSLNGGQLTSTLNTKDVNVSGNISITGNIAITGTVDGVDVSNLNTSFGTISGNVTSHIGSGGSVHALVNTTTNGFMSFGDFNKLATIAQSANNYVHPSGDGNLHVPANGTGKNAYVLKATATAGVINWGIVDWAELSGKPSTFTATAHTHTVSNITDLATNYYNKTEVDTAVANAGDIKAGQANVFKNTNTFNNAGLGIKIQPSANVVNSTKLLQINNTSGNELFSVNYSGGVSIAGDFTVTGMQTFSGTTTVNGDYTINGQLIVGGNSTLGDATTDVTTVNGTLKIASGGAIQQVGQYIEVHRRPLYGIAGDLQFQTDSTVFEDIVDYYDLAISALPSVQSGATRYYRLYAIYSDDITSAQSAGGQKSTIRIAGATNKDIDLAFTWGTANGRRDWLSTYFTDLPTGNGKIQAKLAQANNNLGIRWIELVAYDKF